MTVSEMNELVDALQSDLFRTLAKTKEAEPPIVYHLMGRPNDRIRREVEREKKSKQ